MEETDNPLLSRAYNLSGPAEAEEFYDEWAETYDTDVLDQTGYVAPAAAARRLMELISTPAAVLDAGCGTGLVGAELGGRSGIDVDGVDLSNGMLAQAAARGVYRTLTQADMTEPLPIGADAYDAAICVGTLTEGHLGPETFDELARVVRPSGLVVATILGRVWESGGYRAHVDGLVGRGSVALLEAEEVPYHEREGVTCRLCVLEVR